MFIIIVNTYWQKFHGTDNSIVELRFMSILTVLGLVNSRSVSLSNFPSWIYCIISLLQSSTSLEWRFGLWVELGLLFVTYYAKCDWLLILLFVVYKFGGLKLDLVIFVDVNSDFSRTVFGLDGGHLLRLDYIV